MALTGTMVNPHRIDSNIEGAYAKVAFSEDNYKNFHNFSVYVYYSEADRDGDNPASPIKTFSYSVTGDEYTTFFNEDVLRQENKTVRTQEYAYLKSLPEWEGWTDV